MGEPPRRTKDRRADAEVPIGAARNRSWARSVTDARAGCGSPPPGMTGGFAELLARALMIALVAFGAVALGRLVERHVRTSPTFEVESIAVTGNLRVSEAELLDVAGLATGRNVFDVTPEEAQERLEAHPWIAEAEVERGSTVSKHLKTFNLFENLAR